jgi:hypothetical protein
MRQLVLAVTLRKLRGILQNKEVLGVGVLCLLREVETPSDYSGVVNNHDLVMGDGMLAIDRHWDRSIREKRGTTVLGRDIGLVQKHLHIHTPLVGIQECFGDGCTGEGIRLDQYLLLCRTQFAYDRIGAPPIWGEINADSGGVSVLSRMTHAGRDPAEQENEEYYRKGFMPDWPSAVPIVVGRVACHRVVLLVVVWPCLREDCPVPDRHFALVPLVLLPHVLNGLVLFKDGPPNLKLARSRAYMREDTAAIFHAL